MNNRNGLNVEVVIVGNEIIEGRTLDTNSKWISSKMMALGGDITRIVKVRDDIDEISSVIKDATDRKVDIILVCGGLGPTQDDKTLQGLAKALDTQLVLDEKALEIVKERYHYFAKSGYVETDELTEPRKKMARIPNGGEALYNPVGAAPCVKIRKNETVIFALPGVPRELTAIFEKHVVPFVKSVIGEWCYVEKELLTTVGDESKLAPVIKKVMKLVPRIFIKSHPKEFGDEVHIKLSITTSAESKGKCEGRIQKATKAIGKELRSMGEGLIEEN